MLAERRVANPRLQPVATPARIRLAPGVRPGRRFCHAHLEKPLPVRRCVAMFPHYGDNSAQGDAANGADLVNAPSDGGGDCRRPT